MRCYLHGIQERIMKRREILAQAGLFAGALAASKFSTAAERKYTIALVMKALSNPFFHAMQVGAEEEAGKLGVDLLVQGTNKETDITQQVNIVS